MRTSDQKQNKGLDTESGAQQVLAKPLSLSLSLSLSLLLPLTLSLLLSALLLCALLVVPHRYFV